MLPFPPTSFVSSYNIISLPDDRHNESNAQIHNPSLYNSLWGCLILWLFCSILNSHLKYENLGRPVLRVPCIVLYKILSMPRFHKCYFFCLQLNFLWSSYHLSLLHRNHLKKRNYDVHNFIRLPITSSTLGPNLLITLLLNAVNLCSFLNTRNQVSNTTVKV